MTGLDAVHAAPAPAEAYLGMTVSASNTREAFGVQTQVPEGLLTPGWLGVLADAMAGRPIIHVMPAGHWAPTVSMHIDQVRAARDVGMLSGSGRLLTVNESWAVGSFTVSDESSRPIAVGTARYVPTGAADAGPPMLAKVDELSGPPGDLSQLLGLRLSGPEAVSGRVGMDFTAATSTSTTTGSCTAVCTSPWWTRR